MNMSTGTSSCAEQAKGFRSIAIEATGASTASDLAWGKATPRPTAVEPSFSRASSGSEFLVLTKSTRPVSCDLAGAVYFTITFVIHL